MPVQTLTSLGGPLFVKAAPCAFCGSPSVCLCDWPVEREEWRAAGEVKVGDEIAFMGQRREVVLVETFEEVGLLELTFLRNGTRQAHLIEPTRPVSLLVPGAATCDTPACDLHRRNVGDGRDYCREHWDAWEKAA